MDWLLQYDWRYERTPGGHKIFANVITGCIGNENSAVFVAEREGEIVGYCMCHLGAFPTWTIHAGRKNGAISDMAVAKDSRRQGIGEALFRAAKEWFVAHDVCRIDLDGIVTGNEAAASFWRKMGFSRCSEALTLDMRSLIG